MEGNGRNRIDHARNIGYCRSAISFPRAPQNQLRPAPPKLAPGDRENRPLAELNSKGKQTPQEGKADKAGFCATLFNMGHIHLQNEEIQEAVSAWVTVYLIAKQINLAQALQALADLAPRLGLPEGLEGWETLAQRMQEKSD